MHPPSSVAQVTILVLILRKSIYWNSITYSLSISIGEVHTMSICNTNGMPIWVMHYVPPFVLSIEMLLALTTRKMAVKPIATMGVIYIILLHVLGNPFSLGLHALSRVFSLLLIIHKGILVGSGHHANHFFLCKVRRGRRRAFDVFLLHLGLGSQLFLGW